MYRKYASKYNYFAFFLKLLNASRSAYYEKVMSAQSLLLNNIERDNRENLGYLNFWISNHFYVKFIKNVFFVFKQ